MIYSKIANYVDDNSPFANKKLLGSVTSKLTTDSEELLSWVASNGLKANPDKFL